MIHHDGHRALADDFAELWPEVEMGLLNLNTPVIFRIPLPLYQPLCCFHDKPDLDINIIYSPVLEKV